MRSACRRFGRRRKSLLQMIDSEYVRAATPLIEASLDSAFSHAAERSL